MQQSTNETIKETEAPHKTTRKSPSQICVSSESKPHKANKKQGRAQQKHPQTKKVDKLQLQRESPETHCRKLRYVT